MTAQEQISRRVGRMEMLLNDLKAVKARYKPTDLENQRARELYGALEKTFEVKIPAAPEAETAPAKGKK